MKKERRLVFRGVVFDVYQWKQKLYDGSYATFEELERPDAVQILCMSRNRVVLALEEQPNLEKCMSLFGGVMERGERPLEAAKRELLEESGMTAKRWKLIKRVKHNGRIHYSVYLFAAMDCRKVAAQDLDPGEHIEVITIPFARFLSRVNGIRMEDVFRLYLTEARYEPGKRRKLEALLGMRIR